MQLFLLHLFPNQDRSILIHEEGCFFPILFFTIHGLLLLEHTLAMGVGVSW